MSTGEELERLGLEAVASKNRSEALRLLTPLSDQGSSFASEMVAWIHYTGFHGERDQQLAQLYYRRAAVGGRAHAFYWLGLLLTDSKSTDALQAFEQGAEMGNLSCMYKLGVALTKEGASPRDVTRGHEWLQRAVSRGHFPSIRKNLSIELQNTKSPLKKIVLYVQILRLAGQAGMLYLRDERSERL